MTEASKEKEICAKCGEIPEEHIFIQSKPFATSYLLCPTSTTFILSPLVNFEEVPLLQCPYTDRRITDGAQEALEHLYERHLEELLKEGLARFKQLDIER